MKLKVKWKKLAMQLWNAVKPVLLGAVGGGLVGLTSGCSSFDPGNKTQLMRVVAVGVPGIAVITSSRQTADNSGSDEIRPMQSNPITVKPNIGK